MSKITFVYMRRKYQIIIENPNALLFEVINKLSSTLQISLDNLFCVYHGKSINNTRNKISDLKKRIY